MIADGFRIAFRFRFVLVLIALDCETGDRFNFGPSTPQSGLPMGTPVPSTAIVRPAEPIENPSRVCPGDLSTIQCAGLLLIAATDRD